MAAANRTAFLVIHGVGAHTVFQACDNFITGFLDVFLDTPELKAKRAGELRHEIKRRENWLGAGIPWIQNYVSLDVPEKNTTVDFYEYFWDIYMTHKAPFSEVYKMLIGASAGAKAFYKEHPELLSRASDLGEYGRSAKTKKGEAEFKPAGYLKLLGPFYTFLSFILPLFPPLLTFLNWWAGTRLPIIGKLFEGFSALMREPVPDFAGDLVRYLDLDPRSENFETRSRIINGAFDELRELIYDEDYDRIIIAGHSLGSVIAHDALNRVIQSMNAGVLDEKKAAKIIGLVTFGSPLDKIALFFREHVDSSREVQRQVLSDLHGFRARPIEAKPDTNRQIHFKMSSPIKNPMNNIRWLNFHHKKDLVSGRLDLYLLDGQKFQHLKPDGNILIKKDVPRLAAHGCYWGSHLGEKKGTDQMQKTIVAEFFG